LAFDAAVSKLLQAKPDAARFEFAAKKTVVECLQEQPLADELVLHQEPVTPARSKPARQRTTKSQPASFY